jgi:hypothetical protein
MNTNHRLLNKFKAFSLMRKLIDKKGTDTGEFKDTFKLMGKYSDELSDKMEQVKQRKVKK